MTAATVVVRDIRGPEEMRACQALQRRAWGIVEDGYTVPVATMAAVQKSGGLVLGAFDGRGVLAGFSFAFLGQVHGRLALVSQLTAVNPDCQGLGIGRLIKVMQRERARASGLGAIVWTFDPLQAGNAAFNLGSLGATSRTYEVNLYGSRTDALNAGLATDRLLAEWGTDGEPKPGPRQPHPAAADLLRVVHRPDGLREPVGLERAALAATWLHLEIPSGITALKRASPALARDWQMAVREAFQTAFEAGFVAVGFAGGQQPRYLLNKGEVARP